jgi:predicted SAM-dependent methyltransferase
MISQLLHRNKKISNLVWAVRALFGQTLEGEKEKYFIKKTRHIIDRYMASGGLKKLNIGSQGDNLKGWLNTDIWAGPENVAFLDATKPFPFKDESFDYIFSEHMIEHIRYEQADFMLKECWRILKKGGKIRIATPSLEKFMTFDTATKEVSEYFDQHVKQLYGIPVPCENDYLVNYIFYNFYHKFIYGKASLSHILQSNRFKEVEFHKTSESNDPNLRNVERHDICLGKVFNELETMVAEARKI